MTIRIDTNLINSWTSFHQAFKIAFGFPDFYGENMNAWIDCMSDIDDPNSGMTKFTVQPNETLLIELVNSDNFRKSHEDIYFALLDCTAFVNRRKMDENSRTSISIARQ